MPKVQPDITSAWLQEIPEVPEIPCVEPNEEVDYRKVLESAVTGNRLRQVLEAMLEDASGRTASIQEAKVAVIEKKICTLQNELFELNHKQAKLTGSEVRQKDEIFMMISQNQYWLGLAKEKLTYLRNRVLGSRSELLNRTLADLKSIEDKHTYEFPTEFLRLASEIADMMQAQKGRVLFGKSIDTPGLLVASQDAGDNG